MPRYMALVRTLQQSVERSWLLGRTAPAMISGDHKHRRAYHHTMCLQTPKRVGCVSRHAGVTEAGLPRYYMVFMQHTRGNLVSVASPCSKLARGEKHENSDNQLPHKLHRLTWQILAKGRFSVSCQCLRFFSTIIHTRTAVPYDHCRLHFHRPDVLCLCVRRFLLRSLFNLQNSHL